MRRNRKRPAGLRCIIGLLLILPCTTVPVSARAAQPPDASEAAEPETESGEEKLGLNSDQKVIATLESARRLLSADPGRAIDELRRLQSADPRSMVPGPDRAQTFEPLFRATFALFHQLPISQRQRLADQNSAAASNLLADLLQQDAIDQLPKLILQAPGTPASYHAHLVIARLHHAAGNTMAAQQWLQPLLRPSIADPFRRTAGELNTRFSSTPPPASRKDELKANHPPLPRHLVWQSDSGLSPDLQDQLRKLREAAPATLPVTSTWSSQSQGPLLLTRTLRGIAAVHAQTGRSAWHYRLDATAALKQNSRSSFGRFGGVNPRSASRFRELQSSPAANLFCRDNLTGNVSVADGRVFIVANNRSATAGAISVAPFSRSRATPRLDSRLIALDADSGRRIWSCGAELLRDHFPTDSDYCWMLGPPKAAPQELLCMVEWDNEIHLLALRRSTGEPMWSVPVGYPPQAMQVDPVRQLWKSVPDYHQGLAWCSSTTGWVFCVDTLTRTIHWADFTEDDNVEESNLRVGRGSPVALTQPAELPQRWSRSLLRRIEETLVSCPHTTRHVLLREAASGRMLSRRAVNPGSIWLHVSRDGLLIFEPPGTEPDDAPPESETRTSGGTPQIDVRSAATTAGTLTCLSITDGAVRWSKPMIRNLTAPTGPGVRRRNSVLVTLKSGHLLSVNLNTGDQTVTESTVLPANGWGEFLQPTETHPEQPNDIYYSAPDQLARLSTQPIELQPADPFEHASRLAATGELQNALKVLDQVADAPGQSTRTSELRFHILHQLAQQDPDRWLERLNRHALTDRQQMMATLVEAGWQMNRRNTDSAVRTLIRLLQMERHLTSVSPDRIATERIDLAEPSSDTTTEIERSVRATACRDLNRLLFEMASPDEVVDQIRQLPDDVLLQLHHPMIRQVLHDRIGQELTELNWHLLRHSIELAHRSHSDRLSGGTAESLPPLDAAAETDKAARLVNSVAGKPGFESAVARQLLNQSLLSLPHGFHETLRESDPQLQTQLPTAEESAAAFQRQLSRHFSSWPDAEVKIVPVLRNTSINTSRTSLTTGAQQDPFLRRYQWSASGGDAGRLQGQSIFNADDALSVPGAFDVYGIYSNRTDLLQRCGSVLLLQSYRGIAAVSVFDQRVLWNINAEGEGELPSRLGIDSFRHFDPEFHGLPAQSLSGLVRIVASGDRWVCVADRNRLRMLDLLNGDEIWSYPLDDADSSRFLVTDDIVLIGRPQTNGLATFDRRTGEPIQLPSAEKLWLTGIRSVGDQIVCWTQDEDGDAKLEWFHPRTARISRTVDINGDRIHHFFDDEILVGFADDRTVQITNLVTGDTLTSSFAVPNERNLVPATAATEPPTDPDGPPTRNPPNGPSPDDRPLAWQADQLQAAFDGRNYLIAHRGPPPPSVLRYSSGRTLLAFVGGLRAIDGQSGRLAWHLEGAADQQQLATTDQSELPLLLVIESTPVLNKQGTTSGVQNIFRGIRRTDGWEAFRQPVPSRFGLRYTSFTTPAPHTLNIGLYGRRIEVRAAEPADPDSTSEPDPSPE